MQWIRSASVLTAWALCSAACVASPVDSTQPGDPGEPRTAESAAAVVPDGCYADSTTCPAGAKTCGAWSDYSACSDPVCASFAACGDCSGGDFGNLCGRSGSASGPGTATPQNRTKSCTMHATGASCVQYGYRDLLSHCGC